MANTQSVAEIIRDAFIHAQENNTCHDKYISVLKKLYKKSNIDEFYEAFIQNLKVPLGHAENERCVTYCLEFAATFSVKLTPVVDDGSICPFLEKNFDFIFEKHEAVDSGVRFRICHYLNLILSAMGDNAFLSDELCDKISCNMMIRIMDRSPKVRAQAVCALHRLQEPKEEICKVIDVYIFHLSKDPSADVRKAIIKNIAKNRKTLTAILHRTRDIDESVRKLAYLFFCKVTARSLTIKQRQNVLKDGLEDTSAIRRVVSEILLPEWISRFDNIMEFLYALDIEIDTECGELVLNAHFQRLDIQSLAKELPLDPERKIIPIDKLTSENALYWRCFVRYLVDLSYSDMLDNILPELTDLSNYIREVQEVLADVNSNRDAKLTQRFIILQLFEIVKFRDLSDEVGRAHVKQLIEDTLLNDHFDEKIIKCIVKYYEKVVVSVPARVNTLAHIISDIRIPPKSTDISIDEETVDGEKNDAETMCKCLLIICGVTQAPSVKSVTPIIRSLFHNVALPCIDHESEDVRILALEAVGICSLLDGELAKKHLPLYFFVFAEQAESHDSWLISLTVIFDLLLKYGLEYFDLLYVEDDRSRNDTTGMSSMSQSETANNQFVKTMMGLIDCEVPDVQASATEGFCKLLLFGRITSVSLVSRLILLLHNPTYSENILLCQILKIFFEKYPLMTPGSQQILEKSFFPTISNLLDSPVDGPFGRVEPYLVAQFILNLTSCSIYKSGHEDYGVHNRLAARILNEASNPNSEFDLETLLKSLQYMHIQITDEHVKTQMQNNVDEIIEELGNSNSKLIRYIERFKTQLTVVVNPEVDSDVERPER